MTDKLIKKVDSLLECEFSLKETLQVLTMNQPIYWSWGVSFKCNFKNKGLLLKVNGHHHKGYVLITLNYTDTYSVHLITTHGNLVKTYNMIYVDMLVETIDNKIERIKDYQF